MNDNFLLNLIMNNKNTQNPILNNALQMYRNNDVNGLKAIAENLCKERGVNPEDVYKQFTNKR